VLHHPGLGRSAKPVSILHPDVCDGDLTGLLALHSLSKRSNLAGYRAAFLAGDPDLLKDLLLVRMHGGMIMPGPVQAAMAAALADDAHAERQKELYRARRVALRARWSGRASGSTTPRPASTSGPPAASRAGRRSGRWPSSASWRRRARSTARAASGTCASR
jgi:aspartate/methionine/tyrosine aminotransferase